MPAELRPPLTVALTRAAATIPAADSMTGGVMYEPKWDGFRMLLVVDGAVALWSRQGTDLTPYFPEIVAAAANQLPEGIVLDGEVVLWDEDRLDFDGLLRRINTSSASAQRMARTSPASFAAFDILTVAGQDARGLPLRDRRALLEELAMEWMPPLNLSPMTTDRDVAVRWFEALRDTGIEGLVAKGAAHPYRGGRRSWIKVKQRETLDVICGAVTGSRRRPVEAVIGLPLDGTLRIVGRTSPLSGVESTNLGSVLRAPEGAHPWPSQVKPGAMDRFNRGGRERAAHTRRAHGDRDLSGRGHDGILVPPRGPVPTPAS